MKKMISILLTLGLMTVVAGCASTNQTDANISSETENTITVANGTLPLPEKYDNFAVFGNTHFDHTVSLGVLPVAASMPTPLTETSSPFDVAKYNDGFGKMYANHKLDDIEVLSTQIEASIEKIIAMKPDFIIASDSDKSYLNKLEAIAPTYLIPEYTINAETGMRDWREIHRVFGKLLGKSEQAEKNIATYDALLKDYKDKIGDKTKGKTALIYQISATGKGLWIVGKDSSPQIYSEFGFTLPESFTLTGDYYAFEELVTLNPDYMFINIGSMEEYEKLTQNPIWKNLTAVKNGNVFEYSHYVWTKTNGNLSNTLKLQDVGNFILDGTQTGAHFSSK